MKWYKLFLVFCCAFALAGCQKREVVFEGKVLAGEWDDIYKRVDVTGVVAGARIWNEMDPSEYAVSDANGEYSLRLEAPFVIGAVPLQEYKLIASGANGFSDRITVYAIIGKVNQVRDHLLYDHNQEEWN